MEKTDRPLDLSVFFIARLMKIHGIFARTLHCKICGADNFSGFVFDSLDMGIICEKCSPENPNILKADALRFLSESLVVKFNELTGYTDLDSRGLLFQLSLFLEQYFGIKIRSKKLLFELTERIHL
jgi:recombinational DNA repair protein (RecF pathway)